MIANELEMFPSEEIISSWIGGGHGGDRIIERVQAEDLDRCFSKMNSRILVSFHLVSRRHTSIQVILYVLYESRCMCSHPSHKFCGAHCTTYTSRPGFTEY